MNDFLMCFLIAKVAKIYAKFFLLCSYGDTLEEAKEMAQEVIEYDIWK